MSFTVVDGAGAKLEKGTRVRIWRSQEDTPAEAYVGLITEITEPEMDFDDNLGRSRPYNPEVTVKFDDSSEDKFATYWQGEYMQEVQEAPFVCDDLELAE